MTKLYLIDTAEQGTPEWRQARAGRATGSMAACVTAKSRDGKSEGTTRRDYRVQLALERLTGEPEGDGFVSRYMQDGKEHEPAAREAYEIATGNPLREIGFAYWPNLAIGCSPDAMVEDEDGFGFLEMKCPKPATHWEYLQAARLPPDYVNQATHNALVINDAAFVDFVSFCPKFPEKLQFLRVRVYRNELDIKRYEAELHKFLAETDDFERQLRKRAA